MSDNCRKMRGFTLLEVLIVVAVIAILAGIFIAGAKHITNASKQKQTKVALGTAQGLLTNLDAQTKLRTVPTGWLWYEATGSNNVIDPTATTYNTPQPWGLDFWRTPQRGQMFPPGSNSKQGRAFDALPDALDAPGTVNADGGGASLTSRNASNAVLNTSIVMGLVLAMPASRDVVSKLRADQLFVPEYLQNPSPLPAPGGDCYLGTTDDMTRPPSYPPGCHVKYQGKYYVCTAAGGTTAAPAAGANWADETASGRAFPLLLDGWGNPIIFVPASGLRVRLLADKSSYDPADGNQNFVVTAPDKRPFWASAGPDGDFARGDDNVYSFEQ